MSSLGVWKKPEGKKLTTDKAAKVTFIVYPESAADGWIDYLRSTNLMVAISPVHDRDENSDGTLQKPHHHVAVMYPKSVPWTTWDEIRETINAYKNFEKLRSSSGMINYLTHDSYLSSDKFKYSKDDIIWINCSEADFIEDHCIRIVNLIEDKRLMSFRSLINELLRMDEIGRSLLSWVTKNTYFVNCYLKSYISRKKD